MSGEQHNFGMREAVYSHTERKSLGCGSTQTARAFHVFILTEVEASALNCGHNVLDVRVAQVEGES